MVQGLLQGDIELKKQVYSLIEFPQSHHQKVIYAGGLHVIGTERHESRRIDNQLRGRSGRQGDPGYSKFFLCLVDTVLWLFIDQILKQLF